MIAQVVFGLLLIFIGGWLVWQTDKQARDESSSAHSDDDRKATRARLRRRMFGSILIGLLGLSMITGLLVRTPQRMLWYWGGVLCLVLALVWLALLDVLSTSQHVRRLRRKHSEEQSKMRRELDAELNRLKAARAAARSNDRGEPDEPAADPDVNPAG